MSSVREAMRRIAQVADAAARQLGYENADAMYVPVDPNAPQRKFAPYEPEGTTPPMAAGMADIIATHSHVGVDPESWNLGAQARWYCHGCGALENNPHPDTTKPIWHDIHVAEELTKAGYGNVQEAKRAALLEAADEMPAETQLSTWLRRRAHSLDPDGRALAQAIRDRKAEAYRAKIPAADVANPAAH